MEDKIGKIDVPVYYTKSMQSDVKIERPKHKVGKKYLVTMTKDEFFLRGNILFHSNLWNDDGTLIDELRFFKRRSNGRFEATSGKDDKVNALMLALYVAYTTWVKWDIKRWDIMNWLSREEIIERRRLENEINKQNEEESRVLSAIYADFW
jgi:hypothetical protein